MKRLQTYRAPGITVTFDPNLCIHSAVCLTTLPAVFDIRRRRWVAPEAAGVSQVAAAIDRCPSGALKYALEGSSDLASDDQGEEPGATIQTSHNGPLLVKGDFELLDESAVTIDTSASIALCRCGATGNQPFCDGSHRRVGFKSKRGTAT